MMTKQTEKIRRLVFTAVLMAIILLMCVTPIGYLRAGPVSITFLVIPVALGAILFGPVVGLTLGTFFGATSFMQCFGLLSFYGVDAFGAACFSINPVGTIVMCFVPRMLFGLLTAYLTVCSGVCSPGSTGRTSCPLRFSSWWGRFFIQ